MIQMPREFIGISSVRRQEATLPRFGQRTYRHMMFYVLDFLALAFHCRANEKDSMIHEGDCFLKLSGSLSTINQQYYFLKM